MEEWDGDLPASVWTKPLGRVDLDAWWWSDCRFGRAIALAFAQDVAKGYVNKDKSLHPLLTALDMSAKLLEEILEDVLPEEEMTDPQIPQITQIM